MNIAIVEQTGNRAIAIVDQALAAWFAQNIPIYKQIEILSVGSTSFTTIEGNVSTICILSKTGEKEYHLINRKPEHISLEDAYKLIQ